MVAFRLLTFNRLPLAEVKPGIVPHGVNLFEAKLETRAQAEVRWSKTLEEINALPMPTTAGFKPFATKAEAVKLLAAMKANPIIQNIDAYAPNGGCFARAFVSDLILRRARFHPDSIGKIIKIMDEGQDITHHVGNALRAEDGDWWTFDIFDPRPKKLQTYGYPNTFLTEGTRWGPYGQDAERYSRSHFYKWRDDGSKKPDKSQPLYNGFITDVKRWFKENPHSALDKPVVAQSAAVVKPVGVADQQTLQVLARQRQQLAPDTFD